MNDYESTRYLGLPIAAAHPFRLAWTSRVHGGPQPDLIGARILEIGCGDGATLLPLAAHQSSWRVHGIDASRQAIGFAQDGALAANLANATFACEDLAASTVEADSWDIVIAHGVYSWIDPERRAALLRLAYSALAPNGLAYISFNALPGWSVRGTVRHALLHSHEQSHEVLDRMLAHVGADAWGSLLAAELRRARDCRDDYRVHEYLSAHNEAFWVGDFVRDAAANGLRWIGDAQFDLNEGRPYEQLRASLGIANPRAEEMIDLIGYRQLRCAVLARDNSPISAAPDDAALLHDAVIAGVIAPLRQPFILDDAIAESMRSAGGVDIDVQGSLAKAALLELARIYPSGLRYEDLLDHARRILHEHGLHTQADAHREVAEGVMRLWRAGALELRSHMPVVAGIRPNPPKVSAFTRYEATVRPAISSPLGILLPLDASDRAMVAQFDGSQTEFDLRKTGDETHVDELLDLLARWGLFVAN